MRTAAIVRWTSRGSIDDLVATVLEVASEDGEEVRTSLIGSDLVLHQVDPIRAARALRHLPGVSWIAVGYEFTGIKQFGDRLEVLASKYLGKNSSFSVSANVTSPEYSGGDIVLMANSMVLSGHRGSKVNEKTPRVRFQVSMVDGHGVVGVVIWFGVGGTPTSPKRTAYCLVSGGMHSSAAAWMAAKSGYTIRLAHLWRDDKSLRAVAKLYSELSHRMSAKHLSVQLVRGDGSEAALLKGWWKGAEEIPVLVGLHLECKDHRYSDYLIGAQRKMVFPVAFMSEEEIVGIRKDLGVAETGPPASGSILFGDPKAASKLKIHTYGGVRAEMSTVLDSLST